MDTPTRYIARRSLNCLTAEFIALCLILLSTSVKAQQLEWVKQQGGGGISIAADAVGNSYVTGIFTDTATFGEGPNAVTLTGSSSGSVYIAKYDTIGVLVWVQQGTSANSSEGRGITVDDAGNSYIVGDFVATLTLGEGSKRITFEGSGLFVAKYDPNGVLIWAKHAPGAEGGGMGVDAAGNSYIVGFFTEEATFGEGADAVTLIGTNEISVIVAKYDSNGDFVWVRQTSGINTFISTPDIAVDDTGNTYITSRFADAMTLGEGANSVTLSSVGESDFFVAKYDTNGTLIWAKQSGGLSFDVGRAVDIDDLGNSYITGSFRANATFGEGANSTTLTSIGFSDIFLAKYDSNGTLVWVRQGSTTDSGEGAGIDTDVAGNTSITGDFRGAVTFGENANATTLTGADGLNIFTAKYNSDGVLLWARQAGGLGTDIGFDVAMDHAGNSYVSGSFEQTTTFGEGTDAVTLTSVNPFDGFVAKYSQVTSLKDLVFLADRDVEISRQADSEGNIHANDDIEFERGDPSTHTGNLTAVDNIDIKRRNLINGDATAGNDIDVSRRSAVTGLITKNVMVARMPLPVFSFTTGGDDVEVNRDDVLTLAPGSYGEVEVERRGTLSLSAGEYFMEELELERDAVLEVDDFGGPVTINVEDNLEFDGDSQVVISSGESGSIDLTFNYLGRRGLEIGRGARVLGTINAPDAKVKLDRDSVFKGFIAAEKIRVRRNATFRSHLSTTPLP